MVRSSRDLLAIDDPEEFYLQVSRFFGRLAAQGGTGVGAVRAGRKRWARDLRRRTLRKWRTSHPDAGAYKGSTYATRVVDASVADRIKIILLPQDSEAAAAATDLSKPNPAVMIQRRKSRQRFLRDAFGDSKNPAHARIHGILGPRSRFRRETSARGEASAAGAGPRGDGQLKALDAAGVLLALDLPVDTLRTLESAGATVMDNDVIHLIDSQEVHPVDASNVRTGAPASPSEGLWHIPHVGVSEAIAERSGHGVSIGFLDSGIDASHPAFAGREVRFRAFEADGTIRNSKARDFGWHGTHVAATAAGNVVGLARRAHIAMAAVLTLDRGTSGRTAQLLAGLNWLATEGFAADARTRILNASLVLQGRVSRLLTAFEDQAELGILSVAASGNDGKTRGGTVGSPACSPRVFAVGATDRKDMVADFSNWCLAAAGGIVAKPDACAPGVDIVSAVPGGGYGVTSGTSMAAAVVSGMAAIHASRGDGRVDGAALWQSLLRGAAPAKPSDRAGAGRVDATL